MKNPSEATRMYQRTQDAILRNLAKRTKSVVIGECRDCGESVFRVGSVYVCKKNLRDRSCLKIPVSALRADGKEEITHDEMAALLAGKIVPLKGLVDEKGEVYDYACKLAWGDNLRLKVFLCDPETSVGPLVIR